MSTAERTGDAWRRGAALFAGLTLLLVLAAAATARAELGAGFAAVALPTPPGAPLGGYGGLLDRVASGTLDPPEARALVLESGGKRLALLTLDIVIVRPELREAILQRLAEARLDALTVFATHTHSGPGGYVRGSLAERITAGHFSETALAGLADAGARAVREAAGSLAPARLAAGLGHAALARNRRWADGPRESELPALVLRFGARATPVLVFSYGMHPTVRSPANTRYSADYLGPARAWLERQGYRALFLPGPMGDQGPGGEAGDDESRRARDLGEALAQAAFETVRPLPDEPAALVWTQLRFEPPPFELRRFCALWWLSPLVGGAARRLISSEAPIEAFALGRARLVALPAEPSSALGSAIRAQLREREPHAVPFVLAHADDWLGYAVTPEAYDRGGYEPCLSLHGRAFGERLVEAAGRALAALPPSREP